jgi:hypothetical protein
MVNRGFTGRGVDPVTAARLPPGQHVTQGFPVLSATPTPAVALSDWKFTLKEGSQHIASWSWLEFNQLPRTVCCRISQLPLGGRAPGVSGRPRKLSSVRWSFRQWIRRDIAQRRPDFLRQGR